MRLGQIRWNDTVMAAIFDAEGARPIPDHSLYDLLVRAEVEKTPLPQLAQQQASKTHADTPPIIPIRPPEVWACGCTYKSSAAFRDGEHGTREGFYNHVHRADRPEIFFKGTARVCVGLDKDIGIRQDSAFTAPEPELAVLLGRGGQILGYTLANDVSAWDIERENPLYLPQSKIYNGCCALGPVIVTADEMTDPYDMQISCKITRGGQVIFSGSCSTGMLAKKIDHLIEFLLRSNTVPPGTVLLTGTGIIVPREAALQPGDVVSISAPEIGELRNRAVLV
jgi:2-dehydro-3-deoxy-D-arabinonate dehydratase